MHAASQPPQPLAEGPQSAIMHRVGMLELLSYSTMTAHTAVHALGQQMAHVDDASSQCCGERPRTGAKRAADSSGDDSGPPMAKRARNYAYIEVHVSNSANARKPAELPEVSMT